MSDDNHDHVGPRKRQRMDEVSCSLDIADTGPLKVSVLEKAIAITGPLTSASTDGSSVIQSPRANQNTIIGSSSTAQTSSSSLAPASTLSEPFLPLLKLFSGDMVNVHVGSGQDMKTYSVFKNILTQKSPFFAAAFNPNSFREGAESEISLPQDDPFVFEFILHWMYTSQLPSFLDFVEARPDLTISTGIFLLRLYGMVDVLLLPALQEACFNEIKKHYKKRLIPSKEFISELSCSISADSPLRKLFVDVCCWDLARKDAPLSKELWLDNLDVNESFAADVAKVMARRALNPTKLDLSNHPYNESVLPAHQPVRETLLGAFVPIPKSSNCTDAIELLAALEKNNRKASLAINTDKADKDWPLSTPSTVMMRAAGFYHCPTVNWRDSTRCVHCDTVIVGWKERHVDPIKRHEKHAPQCKFVEAVKLGLDPPLLPFF